MNSFAANTLNIKRNAPHLLPHISRPADLEEVSLSLFFTMAAVWGMLHWANLVSTENKRSSL